MRHAIIIATIALLAFGCKKNEPTKYAIRFEIKGKSSYTYQFGSVNKSGSTLSSATINEVAVVGNLIKCVATADSSKRVEVEYYRDNVMKVAQNANVAEVKEQL